MHRHFFKVLVPLLAIAVVAIPATGALAGGGAVELANQVTIKRSSPTFHGSVKSLRAGCLPNRRVKLYRKQPGKKRRLLGKDQTDRNGKWVIREDKPLRPGTYWAVVKRIEGVVGGTLYACVKARSQAIIVKQH